ncbi:MAG: aldolase [Lentisphaerae bacterium]|nr:MAG: aldolase [Lentisphaerota bacterium]
MESGVTYIINFLQGTAMTKNKFIHPSDQIVAFMKRIYDYGMTTTSGGNLSIMDSDGNMWISPSGVDKGTLRREDIMCVKPDGAIVGPHRPSVEYPFHRAVYKLRPDVKAVLHAHPPALVSFSVAGVTPDTSATSTSAGVCGSVGFAGYDVPGSDGLGELVSAEFAKGHNTTLLRNHGACVVGRTMDEAFRRIETLDFCARMLAHAVTLGKPQSIPADQLADLFTDRNKEFSEFTPECPSSDELEQRRKMAQMARRSYDQFLFTSADGTIAVRLGPDSFLVTPAGADRATLEPADMVLVKGTRYEAGKALTPTAWFIKALFDAQPELNAMIIANPPCLAAYGIANAKFDPRVIPESYIMLREMPEFPFTATTQDTANLLKTLSPRYPIVRIRQQAVISTGKSVLEAFDRLEVAEYSAKATLMAGPLGGMTPMNEQEVADVVKAFKLLP